MYKLWKRAARPATLGPLASCTIQVEFAPDETGAISGNVYVSSSDANSPEPFGVSGTGK